MTEGRYAVGIVNFHTYDDLVRCIRSVRSQTISPSGIVVVDNDPNPRELATVELSHPDVVFAPGPNSGFSAAANQILARAGEAGLRSEFILLLNPDVELEAEFAERLLGAMAEHRAAALGCGKLLRPGNVHYFDKVC